MRAAVDVAVAEAAEQAIVVVAVVLFSGSKSTNDAKQSVAQYHQSYEKKKLKGLQMVGE